MANSIVSKFKKLFVDEEEYEEIEDEVVDEAEDDIEEESEYKMDDISSSKIQSRTTNPGKIIDLHGGSQMKVVIVEPKKYEDATVIADHLKQKKAVVVNLEGLAQDVDTRKEIFYFISGVIYVLGGSMQRISKAIFILAPSNIDIDANMKKELESKTFFPWQK